MRRVVLTALLVLLPVTLLAAEETERTDDLRLILNELDLSEWDRWFVESAPDTEFVPSEFLTTVMLEGTVPNEPSDWMVGLRNAVRAEFLLIARKGILYLGFGVLTAFIGGVLPLENSDTAEIAVRVLGGCMVLGLCSPALQETVALLERIRDGAQVLLPALLGFFSLFDFSASGPVLTSQIAFLSDVAIRIGIDWVIPLALLGGMVQALDCFHGQRIGSISRLCLRIGRWLLRIASSVYLTVTAIRGTVAVHADSVFFRTAKLATGSLPFVGGLVSGSVDTLFECVRLTRSMLGLTGVLVLGGTVLKPMIRLLLEQLMLKGCAALMLPLGAQSYAELLLRLSDMFGLILLVVIVSYVWTAGTVGLVMGVWQGT